MRTVRFLSDASCLSSVFAMPMLIAGMCSMIYHPSPINRLYLQKRGLIPLLIMAHFLLTLVFMESLEPPFSSPITILRSLDTLLSHQILGDGRSYSGICGYGV